MKYGIVVTSSELGNQSAINFATELLNSNHTLHRVFFYDEGVNNALESSPHSSAWKDLHKRHSLDLVVCVTAAKKRGLIAEKDSPLERSPLCNSFVVSGLGQLADIAAHCDRVITFR